MTLFDKLSTLEVINEQGIMPYCPSCRSGEWLHNPDENENDYCGQCGTKLDWSAVHEDRYNDE